MNADRYWTYSCLRSLQIRNIETFFYALGFIENDERKSILMNIHEHMDEKDVKDKLSKIKHIIPVIIS